MSEINIFLYNSQIQWQRTISSWVAVCQKAAGASGHPQTSQPEQTCGWPATVLWEALQSLCWGVWACRDTVLRACTELAAQRFTEGFVHTARHRRDTDQTLNAVPAQEMNAEQPSFFHLRIGAVISCFIMQIGVHQHRANVQASEHFDLAKIQLQRPKGSFTVADTASEAPFMQIASSTASIWPSCPFVREYWVQFNECQSMELGISNCAGRASCCSSFN